MRPKSKLGWTLVYICSLVTAWHVFASFLWISPPSELRKVVPGNVLTEYMIPFYGQSWSVFAPEPINGDYSFHVRAILNNNKGDIESTEWFNATQVEASMSRYNLFPPRAANLSMQQASKLLNNWKRLSAEQKDIVKLGYYEGEAWLGRLHATLNETTKETETLVTDYIVQERYAAAYATQVAYALWGEEDVINVQFRVQRQNIIPFEERHNPDAQRPEAEIADLGWRGTLEMNYQTSEQFEKIFGKFGGA